MIGTSGHCTVDKRSGSIQDVLVSGTKHSLAMRLILDYTIHGQMFVTI